MRVGGKEWVRGAEQVFGEGSNVFYLRRWMESEVGESKDESMMIVKLIV
jgi:hypothetical protein